VTVVQWVVAAVPAFAASLVEFVEALTIVLAVGASRGWAPALGGAGAASLALLALVAVFGPSLANVPQREFQLAVGALLLLFGVRWLRKACLRRAGIIPLHDEVRAYERVRARLGTVRAGSVDWPAAAASFNGVLIEGIEVVFIVLALGASARALLPAIGGAAAGFFCVVLLGIAVHRPLARVPENALKLGVGVMLTAFGTLWIGEGLDLRWPGGDLAVIVLAAGYLAAALAATTPARRA
jgi:uncharacterized membrane protein